MRGLCCGIHCDTGYSLRGCLCWLPPAMDPSEDRMLRLRDENTALKKENNELRIVIKRCCRPACCCVSVEKVFEQEVYILLLCCATSMKTKLAIIEEKAAKLQNGWSAQQTLQKRAASGESPP